jgi:hypothetical protein
VDVSVVELAAIAVHRDDEGVLEEEALGHGCLIECSVRRLW